MMHAFTPPSVPAETGPASGCGRSLGRWRPVAFQEVTDFTQLPPDLPAPDDDGLADHLPGLRLPDVDLEVAGGGRLPIVGDPSRRWSVLYVYPRTGGPGIGLPADWDMIPGARGCTPQACAFRDHHAALADLDATVVGISAQPIEEQESFARRMHMPFPLLNDADLLLAEPELSLPTFTAGGMTLYRRVTLIAERSVVRHVFYPVFPPSENASDVVRWLTAHA